MGPATLLEVVVALMGTTLMGSLIRAAAASEGTGVSTFKPDAPYTHCNTGDLYITAYINITYQDKNNYTYTENSEIAKFGKSSSV